MLWYFYFYRVGLFTRIVALAFKNYVVMASKKSWSTSNIHAHSLYTSKDRGTSRNCAGSCGYKNYSGDFRKYVKDYQSNSTQMQTGSSNHQMDDLQMATDKMPADTFPLPENISLVPKEKNDTITQEITPSAEVVCSSPGTSQERKITPDDHQIAPEDDQIVPDRHEVKSNLFPLGMSTLLVPWQIPNDDNIQNDDNYTVDGIVKHTDAEHRHDIGKILQNRKKRIRLPYNNKRETKASLRSTGLNSFYTDELRDFRDNLIANNLVEGDKTADDNVRNIGRFLYYCCPSKFSYHHILLSSMIREWVATLEEKTTISGSSILKFLDALDKGLRYVRVRPDLVGIDSTPSGVNLLTAHADTVKHTLVEMKTAYRKEKRRRSSVIRVDNAKPGALVCLQGKVCFCSIRKCNISMFCCDL
jgi:hypothetical protein